MNFKLTTICENTVMKRGLLGEHGYAVLIEIDNKRYLMDLGSGLTLMHNALKLRINLLGLDGIILSHGHFDHTGGTKDLLEFVRSVYVYGHPDLFNAKYKITSTNDKPTYVGIPYTKEQLEKMGARFKLSRNPLKLTEHLFLTGEIIREDIEEGFESSLFVKKETKFIHDYNLDDMAAVINFSKGAILLLGCAHAGVINTIKYANSLLSNNYIKFVVGGTHLKESSEKRITKLILEMQELGVEYVYPCHCTGIKGMSLFSQIYGRKFTENNVGTIIEG